jgi:UDPglucose 6-dehydrogenase
MMVKVYGYGWVGKAMKTLFPDAVIHDPALNFVAVGKCDIAFVCVPSPCHNEGKLDTSIVEEVIKNAQEDLIVIRSTVNPGDCDRWEKKYKKRICFQPEYLGETVAHPLLDQKARPFIIIGGNPEDRRQVIELYQTVYNANTNIRQMTNYEAEVVKLSENRAISFKVAQCQELYDVCELANIDYNVIREAVYSDDPRFNLWWTFVYPDKRGFQSKCLPKDVIGWCAWAESLGYEPKITRAILSKNKEWING